MKKTTGDAWRSGRAAILALISLYSLGAPAQQGPGSKASPSLPAQASEQAQQKVAEHTAPTVSLTAPANNALYTAPATVLLEASANASSSGRSITQVEFFADATLIGTVTATPYRFNWTSVVARSYSLTAKATDNLGVASTSAPVAIIVNAPPTISLTSPANDTVFTAPATIDLAATAADTDGTVTQVEFFQGATLIATDTSAPYTHTLNNVVAGSYSFTARATDNQGAVTTSAAVNVTVNAPPTVTLASPAHNATFTAPADITIAANAQDTDGTIAQVEFFEGANLIGTRSAPPYSVLWTGVAAGSYSLTARATDNQGGSTTSASVNVTVNTGVAQLYFIHTDHLNTPRLITNGAGQAVWRWDQTDPFGGNVPDENPSGLGTFTCNLRLPGQYFDMETNLHYNYFRDYDPGIGRYVEFDLIGLRGGINGYAYVSSNPLSQSDPTGLAVWLCLRSTSFGIGNHAYFYDDKTKQCCGDPGPGGKNPLQACREKGRQGDSCVLISTNDDEAQKLLRCCNEKTNKSFYFPGISDCQNLADDCIRQLQMAPTATPGFNRWRPCPSCFRQ